MYFDLKRVVRVSDKTGTKGGTGYLLGQDRVLTARHVLRGLESPVVTYEHRESRLQTPVLGDAWQSPGNLDIAVLRINTELAIGNQRLSGDALPTDAAWRSRGWAVAGKALRGKTLLDSMTALAGIAFSFEAGQEKLELSVEAPPDGTEWWKGASGAPVFCDTRLVGVVRGGVEVFKGGRLLATPLAAVWDLPGFPEAVGYGGDEDELRQARRRKLVIDLAERLDRSSKAARAIADERAEWREVQEDPGRGNKEFAEVLCASKPWWEVLKAFESAHTKLLEEKPQEWQRATQVILEILERVLPEIYGSTELDVVAGFEGGQLVDLPIETETLAELAMAALDGRPLSFREVKAQKQFPLGTGLVTKEIDREVVNEGFNFHDQGAFHSWLGQLAKWICLDDGDLQRTLEEHRYDDLAQLVNQALEREVKLKQPRRYFVFDRKLAADHADFLAQVREKVKALHLVEMSARTRVKEREDCGPLLDILFRSYLERISKL